MEAFDKSLVFDPNNSDAWYAKGLAQEKLGEKDKAQKSFDESKKINHDRYTSLVNDGIADLTNIRYAEALESFDKAILINPDISDAWYYKGQALYNLQRYLEAVGSFDKALIINPNDGDAWYIKGRRSFFKIYTLMQ